METMTVSKILTFNFRYIFTSSINVQSIIAIKWHEKGYQQSKCQSFLFLTTLKLFIGNWISASLIEDFWNYYDKLCIGGHTNDLFTCTFNNFYTYYAFPTSQKTNPSHTLALLQHKLILMAPISNSSESLAKGQLSFNWPKWSGNIIYKSFLAETRKMKKREKVISSFGNLARSVLMIMVTHIGQSRLETLFTSFFVETERVIFKFWPKLQISRLLQRPWDSKERSYPQLDTRKHWRTGLYLPQKSYWIKRTHP